MRKLLTVLLALFVSNSYGQVLELTNNLFPISTGNVWQYQVNSNSENIITETALQDVRLYEDGYLGVDMIPVADDFPLFQTTTYYVKDEYGPPFHSMGIARLISDGDQYTFSPAIPVIDTDTGSVNVNLKLLIDGGTVGLRLASNPDENVGLSYTSLATVTAIDEMVTVPAGTFSTVKVELQVTLNGVIPGEGPLVDATENRVYWLAEGVGVVKKTISSDGETDEFELVSYVVDSDVDGILEEDNCPNMYNPAQNDTDNDGMGDACDDDDDNDGVPDDDDAFPLNPDESVDTDNDGIGDNGDNCPVIYNPLQENNDLDDQGDDCDSDDDNDGVSDASDSFPLNPEEWSDNDNDNIGDNADPDDDNDGVIDINDAFPFDSSESVDTDNDGIGNNADEDDDNDGVSDLVELESGRNPLINEGVIIQIINSSED